MRGDKDKGSFASTRELFQLGDGVLGEGVKIKNKHISHATAVHQTQAWSTEFPNGKGFKSAVKRLVTSNTDGKPGTEAWGGTDSDDCAP